MLLGENRSADCHFDKHTQDFDGQITSANTKLPSLLHSPFLYRHSEVYPPLWKVLRKNFSTIVHDMTKTKSG